MSTDDDKLEIVALRYVIGYANLEDGWRVGLFNTNENGEKVKMFTFPLRGEVTEARKEEISKALTEFVAACEQPDYIAMRKFDNDTDTDATKKRN